MDTRGKSNTEFRNEVSEILARHESNFDQIHNTLQTILAKLQTLQTNLETTDVNPFAPNDTHCPSHFQSQTIISKIQWYQPYWLDIPSRAILRIPTG